MYQEQNPNPFVQDGISNEKDFDILVQAYEKSCLKIINLNNSTWDLTKTYNIDWVCLNNNPQTLGLTCKIIQKNNKVALVKIETDNLNLSLFQSIFRLEDLSAMQ